MSDYVRKQIEKFCSHCDYKDDRDTCSGKNQWHYVHRQNCLSSKIQEVSLRQVTMRTMTFDEVKYDRDNMDEIMKAVAKKKE